MDKLFANIVEREEGKVTGPFLVCKNKKVYKMYF